MMRRTFVCLLLAACSGGDTTPPGSTQIVVGMAAPVTGVNQGLGTGMQLGIQLAFDEQNLHGGVAGRQLQLTVVDTGDDPTTAETAARHLVDAQATADSPKCPSTSGVSATALERGPNAVTAMIGAIGSQPTIAREAEIAVETGTVFFGAANGSSSMLRDLTAGACAQYIFNYRASYIDEAHGTAALFQHRGVPSFANMISFDQNDTLGDAGYNALRVAYMDVYGDTLTGTTPITRVRYTRNDDTSVPAAAVAAETYIKSLLASQSGTVTVGVMMTDTYGASAMFVQAIRNWQFAASPDQTQYQMATRLALTFSNVSVVQPDSLAQDLQAAGFVSTPSGSMPYARDVYVSEVVPNFRTDSSPLVAEYTQLLAGQTPTFLSLEGYLSARVFIAGLALDPGTFTGDSLVADFESMFPAGDHTYTHTVYGVALGDNGTFTSSYTWNGTFTPMP